MTIKEVGETYGVSGDTLRYYERVGMIPPVKRTAGGIRDYDETAVRWVELAVCMRNAGLPVEAIIEYVRLYEMGDETIPARLALLREQREHLYEQTRRIDETLARLDDKIPRYEVAEKTGRLTFDKNKCESGMPAGTAEK